MRLETIGIVGHGAFGALLETLITRFAPHTAIKIFEPERASDNKRFFALRDAAQCDVVLIATPITDFEEVLKKLLPLAKRNTIIVDVATVKVHTCTLLRKLAKGKRYIATHPVWGPESYKKRERNISGFRIVVAEHTLPAAEFKAAAAYLGGLGFDIVEMDADTHDKRLAETLFLTHFMGQLISRAGFGRTEVDTVSYGFLMDAVESVKHDEKLFRDVFRFNPYCKSVLARIAKAEVGVRSLLENTIRDGKKKQLRIGVPGVKGSFSEEAARTYAKKNALKDISLDYLVSVENVLAKLASGEIDMGIFPIENSTGGVVLEAVHAMAKHSFKLKKMFDIDIRQNLIVKKRVTASGIKTITSHDQALRQCKTYLKKNWRGVKIKEYADTAKAAADLAAGKLPATTAVIASRAAADIYKLKILEAGIQDLKDNLTTFVVATRA